MRRVSGTNFAPNFGWDRNENLQRRGLQCCFNNSVKIRKFRQIPNKFEL